MTPTAIAIVIMTVLAMSSVLAFVLVQNTGPRARLKVRLAAIAGDAKDGSSLKKGAQQKGRSRSISIKSKLEEAGGGQASRRADLHLRIEQAGMSTTIQTFYVASAVAAVVASAIYLVLGYPWWGAVPVALVFGLGLPRRVLTSKAAKRQKHFTQHFADAIDVIVRGIKSGLPVGECLNIIARESPEPVCTEFKLLVEGQKVGMTLKQALDRSCRRMPTADMKFFAIVLNLQQQTGGNLAETLAGLSDVLRQRKKMADKVRAMSSEARMTAMIIGAMPFLIMAIISIFAPDYIGLLFTTSTGKKIVGFGITWMGIGVFIMKQMISFEI
jgi:tight adherence protein B